MKDLLDILKNMEELKQIIDRLMKGIDKNVD